MMDTQPPEDEIPNIENVDSDGEQDVEQFGNLIKVTEWWV